MQRERGDRLLKEVRATIAKASAGSVFIYSLEHLRKQPNDGIDWYGRAPFVPLLIVKWAAELWSPREPRRDLSHDEYLALVQKIWDANGDQRLQQQRIAELMRALSTAEREASHQRGIAEALTLKWGRGSSAKQTQRQRTPKTAPRRIRHAASR